jgi:hypothetical protein
LSERTPASAARYVGAYREASDWLAEQIADVEAPARLAVLADAAAASGPLGVWVAAYGPAGVLLDLLSRLRAERPRAVPLEPPTPTEDQWQRWIALCGGDSEILHFHRLVLRALAFGAEVPALERVMDALDLSVTDLGRLFSVSRQAASQWLERGEVPPERQDKLQTLVAVVDLLEHKLKPDRLPGIARRPADAYGGRTMLELIEQDDQRLLLEETRASFDWAATA